MLMLLAAAADDDEQVIRKMMWQSVKLMLCQRREKGTLAQPQKPPSVLRTFHSLPRIN